MLLLGEVKECIESPLTAAETLLSIVISRTAECMPSCLAVLCLVKSQRGLSTALATCLLGMALLQRLAEAG